MEDGKDRCHSKDPLEAKCDVYKHSCQRRQRHVYSAIAQILPDHGANHISGNEGEIAFREIRLHLVEQFGSLVLGLKEADVRNYSAAVSAVVGDGFCRFRVDVRPRANSQRVDAAQRVFYFSPASKVQVDLACVKTIENHLLDL